MAEPTTEAELAELIATDLTKRNFFGWLLANGSSPLWAERTPEQEMARMAAAVVAPELERLRAERKRCPSCDHLVSQHQPEGCWYAVSMGALDRDVVCPCAVPLATLRAKEADRG